jgi:Ca-activated chloride channel family protein
MRILRTAIPVLAALLAIAACTSSKKSEQSLNDPGKCIVVDVATSPEKGDLMTSLAKSFNGSDRAKLGKDCIFVRPQNMSSGQAAQLLSSNWDEHVNGPRPVVWSPAATSWGQIVNEQRAHAGQPPIVPKGDPIMVTPLTIAMPKPMADALGYPAKPIGWTDILNLAKNQQGWGAFGHPEWGAFKLGKTNPNFSTSGLNALIAQTYAATGKTSGLSAEDLDNPAVIDFGTAVESTVVHYGDTTLTFLNNLYRADQRGQALTYVSAVAVEEKSVIDYNQGNPDGVLSPGEQPRPPKVPLVAIYPKEGTLFSDSPYFILDAPWVTQQQKDAAKVFEEFVKEPDNQKQVLSYHFRPGNPAVAIGDPIVPANGVDPNQPQTLLDVPQPAVLTKLLDEWSVQRKKARVAVVLDVSGSMGDLATPNNPGFGTKLDLAKEAIANAIGVFSADDIVEFDIFSTGLGDAKDQKVLQLVPPSRVGDITEQLPSKVDSLTPQNGTPLYEVTENAYTNAVKTFDPARINAVVLLTDGKNDDGTPDDDAQQYQHLLATLRSGNEGQLSHPVRVFPIAYGTDADVDALKGIADASNSAEYDAKDPTTINQVLTAVISNF